jgi:hypothetical protein
MSISQTGTDLHRKEFTGVTGMVEVLGHLFGTRSNGRSTTALPFWNWGLDSCSISFTPTAQLCRLLFPDGAAQESHSNCRMHGRTKHEEGGHPEDVKDRVESAHTMNPEVAQDDIEPMADARDEVSH